MFKTVLSFIAIVFISSCCERKYPKESFDFTEEERAFFSAYSIGDTLYFRRNLGDIDTFSITNISSDRREKNCFMGKAPSHSKVIIIRHLPVDKWMSGGVVHHANGTIDSLKTPQRLFAFSKSPISHLNGFSIQFKDFSYWDTTLRELHNELSISDSTLVEVYKLSRKYPERIKLSSEVEFLYWTKEKGLVAYSNKGGETWFLIPKSNL